MGVFSKACNKKNRPKIGGPSLIFIGPRFGLGLIFMGPRFGEGLIFIGLKKGLPKLVFIFIGPQLVGG